MNAAPARIRRAEPSDLGAVADLLNACDVAELGAPDTTIQDIENDWRADGFDVFADAWVAVANDGRLVGYAYAGDQLRTGQLEADFWVHPDHADPTLAGRLLRLAERRACVLARQGDYGPAAELDVFALAGSTAKASLLRQHGFALSRTVHRMAAELSAEPSNPRPVNGVAIRPFRVGVDDRALYDAIQESFAGSVWHSEEPYTAWKARLEEHADFDPNLWLLAWEGEELVGGVLAYDHGDLGWIKALGVRPAWRRRGIGGALLEHAFSALARRGQQLVELGLDTTDATNPGQLYEHAGMRIAFAYELYVKRLTEPAVSSP